MRRIAILLWLLIVGVPLALAQESCAENENCTEVAMGIPAEAISAYPRPDVMPLAVDDSVLLDRNYRQLKQAVEVFDTPGGNVVSAIAAGFNFVTASSDQNGWTQINPNRWVQSEFLGAATVSRFSGVFLPEEMPYPMAWMLVNAVPSRSPGVEPLDGDLPVLRYTRINIYDSVDIEGWRWYQIGNEQWVKQTVVAKVLPVERPADVNTERWVSVDLYEQVLIAYEGETPVFTTLVSSGLPEWSTNEGLFNVYVRYPRTVMSGGEGQPDFYYLEEVPWTMYFDNDIGLHGTYWHDGFGYRHSHGCVNLSITDSHWLYNWASVEFDFTVPNDEGIAVYVYSSGEYR
jgi:lipoprotein-anchoring transpeptidase ErfK/SrfK